MVDREKEMYEDIKALQVENKKLHTKCVLLTVKLAKYMKLFGKL
jgi:hypothetical protein